MSPKVTRHLGAVILLAAITFAASPSSGQAPAPAAAEPPRTDTKPPPPTPLPPLITERAAPPVALPPGAPAFTQPRATNPPASAAPVPVMPPRGVYRQYEYPSAAPVPTPGAPAYVPTVPAGPANYAAPNHTTRRSALSPEPVLVPRGEQIIRDAKLKVLQHHYETALSEVMEIRRSLLTAPSDQRETLEAKIKVLQGFTERLEKDIRKLGVSDASVPPTPAAMIRQHQRTLRPSKVGPYDASQATGEPDADANGGDSPQAWCPASTSSEDEWLTLSYDFPVEVAEIRIHETYATGALARVEAKLHDARMGQFVQDNLLWKGTEPQEATPTVRVIAAEPGVTADWITLRLEPRRTNTWQEIDAVELVGRDGSRQWASQANSSGHWGRGPTVLPSIPEPGSSLTPSLTPGPAGLGSPEEGTSLDTGSALPLAPDQPK